MKTPCKFSILILVLIFIFISSIACTQNHKSNNVEKTAESKGIYILYKDKTTRVKYMNDSYEELSDVKVAKAWKLCPVEQQKVYVSIAGDANSVGTSLSVLKNGNVINDVILKYDMPKEIRYNPYNKCAYVSHTYKLTYNQENCISVIDTEKDKEVSMIMYDEIVNDMAFADNDLMFVSSTDAITPENNLDVFDLIENKLVKHIPLDVNLGSIIYSPETKLLYGIKEGQEDPLLYVINWDEGKIVDKIKLNYDYPCKLTLNNEEGKEVIYISNVNIDNSNEGNVITLLDPGNKKIIKEITKADGIHDYIVDNNIYVVARMNNQAYIISKENKLIKKIEIPFPISITEAY